jgi:hypothetical protein
MPDQRPVGADDREAADVARQHQPGRVSMVAVGST